MPTNTELVLALTLSEFEAYFLNKEIDLNGKVHAITNVDRKNKAEKLIRVLKVYTDELRKQPPGFVRSDSETTSILSPGGRKLTRGAVARGPKIISAKTGTIIDK